MKKSDGNGGRKIIKSLVMGDQIFASSGFSTVKITKNGKEEFVDIPIKSFGAEELKAHIREEEPKAPVTRKFIKRNSEEGKAAGISKSMFCDVYNLADNKYQKELTEYQNRQMWRTVAYAVDIEFKDKTNEKATDLDDKVAILKSVGLTFSHVLQIWEDVMKLTKQYDDELDFLSEDL